MEDRYVREIRMILDKKQMSEEDIKLNFITPAVQMSWSDHITMETKITDGQINIKGNMVARNKPNREIQIPMPPIEEQRRIAEKIEELMPYCDQLIK